MRRFTQRNLKRIDHSGIRPYYAVRCRGINKNSEDTHDFFLLTKEDYNFFLKKSLQENTECPNFWKSEIANEDIIFSWEVGGKVFSVCCSREELKKIIIQIELES